MKDAVETASLQVIKMRSVGWAIAQRTSVLIKREIRIRDRYAWWKDNMKTGICHRQDKEHLRPPEAGERPGTVSSSPSPEGTDRANTLIWDLQPLEL